MSLLDRFFNINNEAPAQVGEKRQKSKAVSVPQKRQKFRTHEDIRRLETAILNAENIYTWNREDLNRIYRRVVEDPMLWSQWTNRANKTIEREFMLTLDGEENEEATDIFNAGWFTDYMHAMLEAKLWGFTLVEFGAISDNRFISWRGEKGMIFPPVTVIDRDYVKPETGQVVHLESDLVGMDIYAQPQADWLILEGAGRDWGLMRKIAKYILFKDNVLGNWGEWAEVFGMDIRIGKTDKQGDERRSFVDAIRDLAANGNGVFSKDEDEIEYIGAQRSDAFRVYEMLARYCDEQIAKLISGQDVVSNNTGRVVGTVGENILNMYGEADAKFLQRNINDKLIPLMQNLGFTLPEGIKFEWDNTESLGLMQQAEKDVNVVRMGFNLKPSYVEGKYNVVLDEENPTRQDAPNIEAPILDIKNELKDFYGKD